MEFDAFACILKGGGGRVAPESLKIQPIRWICMVLEGPPPHANSKTLLSFRILMIFNDSGAPPHPSETMQIHRILWISNDSRVIRPPHPLSKASKSKEFHRFSKILGTPAPPTLLSKPCKSMEFHGFSMIVALPSPFQYHANQ